MLEASEKQSTRDGDGRSAKPWADPGLKLEAIVGNQGEEKMWIAPASYIKSLSEKLHTQIHNAKYHPKYQWVAVINTI